MGLTVENFYLFGSFAWTAPSSENIDFIAVLQAISKGSGHMHGRNISPYVYFKQALLSMIA